MKGTRQNLSEMTAEPFKTALKRFCVVVIFGVAFGYIEAAVVVYLRAIFHPDGFVFPLVNFGMGPLWRRLLLTEVGREAATIALISTGAWLFGRSRQERFAYFMVVFAVWDIFYYVWLKVLIDWPGSIMDWDILFLIPVSWASPVLAPVLISLTLLVFAAVILYSSSAARPIKVTLIDGLGFLLAAVVIVVSFCIGGLHITEPDYQSYFYWPLFGLGYAGGIALYLKCMLKPGRA
ncbi:MAG: hypothetical protein ACYSR6_03850 [Planctomycetota bacterium]|jgi:hypothetical protein